jgi:hypothetical protein
VVVKVISGGKKLQAALKRIAKKANKAAQVNVGFLGHKGDGNDTGDNPAVYPDGTPVAMVAAIMEYGAPSVGVPPRSFFRTMVQKKQGKWGEALGRNLVAQDFDSEKAMRAMGEGIQGQLRDSISELDAPALSPVTLMLRKLYPVSGPGVQLAREVVEARMLVELGEDYSGVSTKPLIWTGHLQQSADYEVISS